MSPPEDLHSDESERRYDSLAGLVTRVRDHHVAQFDAFVARCRSAGRAGSHEVAFQIEGKSFFRDLVIVDFVESSDRPNVIAFVPDAHLSFSPISFSIGEARFVMDRLRWNDVQFELEPIVSSAVPLDSWFDRWFALDRSPKDGQLHDDVIHALMLDGPGLNVDFGTAPDQAFWELLHLLVDAGARSVRISSSAPADPED